VEASQASIVRMVGCQLCSIGNIPVLDTTEELKWSPAVTGLIGTEKGGTETSRPLGAPDRR